MHQYMHVNLHRYHVASLLMLLRPYSSLESVGNYTLGREKRASLASIHPYAMNVLHHCPLRGFCVGRV